MPDIAYVIHHLSWFVATPRSVHLHVVHHVLRYLKGAPGQGLFFQLAPFYALWLFRMTGVLVPILENLQLYIFLDILLYPGRLKSNL